MFYKVIPFMLILLVSCGKNPFMKDHFHNPENRDPRTNTTTNAVFQPYIEDFEYDYDQYIGDIPMNFADLEGNRVGVCYTWSSGHAEIEIDRTFWADATELERKAVVYHELGHCELGRDHFDEMKEDGCAASIMNWILVRDSCMDIHLDDYIEELFK